MSDIINKEHEMDLKRAKGDFKSGLLSLASDITGSKTLGMLSTYYDSKKEDSFFGKIKSVLSSATSINKFSEQTRDTMKYLNRANYQENGSLKSFQDTPLREYGFDYTEIQSDKVLIDNNGIRTLE